MSFDMDVFQLGWDFILAGERYRTLNMAKVPADDQHEMCGLFKQATFGDIDINYAGATGAVLRNCLAWKACNGITKLEAIRRYVAKSDQLVNVHQ